MINVYTLAKSKLQISLLYMGLKTSQIYTSSIHIFCLKTLKYTPLEFTPLAQKPTEIYICRIHTLCSKINWNICFQHPHPLFKNIPKCSPQLPRLSVGNYTIPGQKSAYKYTEMYTNSIHAIYSKPYWHILLKYLYLLFKHIPKCSSLISILFA